MQELTMQFFSIIFGSLFRHKFVYHSYEYIYLKVHVIVHIQ